MPAAASAARPAGVAVDVDVDKDALGAVDLSPAVRPTAWTSALRCWVATSSWTWLSSLPPGPGVVRARVVPVEAPSTRRQAKVAVGDRSEQVESGARRARTPRGRPQDEPHEAIAKPGCGRRRQPVERP